MIESRRSYLWRWSLPGFFTSFLINNSNSACAQGQCCPIAWVRAKRLGGKRSPFGFCLWRMTYLDIEKYLEDWEKWKWTCESLSHVWLCNPIDCSLPVHGILQARILESVAIPFSRVSSQPRLNPYLPHCRQILYHLSLNEGFTFHLIIWEHVDIKDAKRNMQLWFEAHHSRDASGYHIFLERKYKDGDTLLIVLSMNENVVGTRK